MFFSRIYFKLQSMQMPTKVFTQIVHKNGRIFAGREISVCEHIPGDRLSSQANAFCALTFPGAPITPQSAQIASFFHNSFVKNRRILFRGGFFFAPRTDLRPAA